MLVVVPERWDEACFAVAAVRGLVGSGLIGGLVCREEQEGFWETVCQVPRFSFSAREKAGVLMDKLGAGWEAALVLEDGVAAKAIAKLKVAKRIGPDEGKLAKLLTHPLQVKEGSTEHRVRMYLKTCEQIGVSVDRAEYFEAAALGVAAERDSVLLCPGSDFGLSHEWPLDRWQELGGLLLEKGKRVAIVGESGGRGLGKILSERLGSGVDFFHATPLAAALPLLAAYETVIAADGSLPHLAAHAGARCVTLFGPNDAVWKRPLGKRHVVVKRHVECAPCLSPKCLLDSRCQRELELGRVLAAI